MLAEGFFTALIVCIRIVRDIWSSSFDRISVNTCDLTADLTALRRYFARDTNLACAAVLY